MKTNLKGGKAKGKKSEEEVAKRQLHLLRKLFTLSPGNSLSFQELKEIYHREFKLAKDNRSIINSDIAKLKDFYKIPIEETVKGIGVPPVGIDGLFHNTDIGKRLREEQDSKRHLAAKVSSFIIERQEEIRRVLLGSGTTVYAVARDLFACYEAFKVKRVYTANLLVIREYIYQRPPGIQLVIPTGDIDYECGVIKLEESREYFSKREIDAIVVSFNGVKFKSGFSTGDTGDKQEKLANMLPEVETCKYIIIPMDWSKINFSDQPIADSRDEQLNFAQGKRKYILVTNAPSGKMSEADKAKKDDLQQWHTHYEDHIILIYK